MKQGLGPVVDEKSRILILGSFPGEESLRLQRYYMHPRNQFWEILSKIYSERIPTDNTTRLEFLQRKGLALWDVLKGAERKGSLDSAIKKAEPNDFCEFFGKYPEIRAIAFNGGKSQKLYRKHVSSMPEIQQHLLQMTLLPSTSPTPGKYVLSFEKKVARWKACLDGD